MSMRMYRDDFGYWPGFGDNDYFNPTRGRGKHLNHMWLKPLMSNYILNTWKSTTTESWTWRKADIMVCPTCPRPQHRDRESDRREACYGIDQYLYGKTWMLKPNPTWEGDFDNLTEYQGTSQDWGDPFKADVWRPRANRWTPQEVTLNNPAKVVLLAKTEGGTDGFLHNDMNIRYQQAPGFNILSWSTALEHNNGMGTNIVFLAVNVAYYDNFLYGRRPLRYGGTD